MSEEAINHLVTQAVPLLPEVKPTGRPRAWSNEDVVFLALYSIRSGIDATDIATREGWSVRTTQDWIKAGKDALDQVQPVLPDGSVIADREHVLDWCAQHGQSALVDGTEFGVEHPESKTNPYGDKQKEQFSGKKKTHTLKVQAISDEDGNLLDICAAVGGSVHDYKLLERSGWIPEFAKRPEVTVGGDSAYVGLNKVLETVLTPRKKKPNQERSDEDKLWNLVVARWRVSVEHAIGKLKRFKSLRKVKLHAKRTAQAIGIAFLLVTYQQAWPKEGK